MSKVGVVMD